MTDATWTLVSVLFAAGVALALLLYIGWRDRRRRREARGGEDKPLIVTGQGASREDWFGCVVCGRIFPFWDDFAGHMKEEHPGRPRVFHKEQRPARPGREKPAGRPCTPAAVGLLLERYGGATLDGWVQRAVQGRVDAHDIELMIAICHHAQRATANRLRVRETAKRLEPIA